MKLPLCKPFSLFVQRRLPTECRGGKRFAPPHRTICLIQSPGDEERTTTLVHNISDTGVAIKTQRPYAPGTLLHVLFVNEAHTFTLSLDLSVARCLRMGDRCLVAGSFSRSLTHAEVMPFIL